MQSPRPCCDVNSLTRIGTKDRSGHPRLKIARNLLTGDGIILISISDEEMHNLRSICDEIFGYENFCGAFVWEKKEEAILP